MFAGKYLQYEIQYRRHEHSTHIPSVYNQLMAKLFRLPKFIQMEIGKALIANASEEFEKEE